MTAEEGLLLALHPHGEHNAIATIFTKESGLKRGLIKGARKKSSFLQIGNNINVTHTRRLSHQLGTFSVEAHKNYTALHMMNHQCLAIVQYLSELLAKTLPEEQALPQLFNVTDIFLQEIGEAHLWQRLAFYELTFLTSMGYGLSLSADSGAVLCESNTPLTYVSPKTGRAVSQVMGHPFKDKLLPLPHLFGGPEVDEPTDLHNTFYLTGFFINQILHNHEITSRTRALQTLKTNS